MHDLAIIGGGPAGLAAAIYAARYKLKTALFAAEFGMISKAPSVENYPGIERITGLDLAIKMRDQAKKTGADIRNAEAVMIKRTKEGFEITEKAGKKTDAKTLILAMGSANRKLNIEGEDKYLGKGISYCSTCDAPLFKKKAVAVVGGSSSAAASALHLAGFAKATTIVYRGDELRAEPMLVQKLKEKGVQVITKANVAKLKGDKTLTGVELDNGQEIKLEGLFIEIGQIPSTALAKQLGIKLTKEGYIEVDQAQATNVKGVFAAGDVTDACNNMKQIITAAAQGAVAANAAFKFLNN